MVISLPNNSLLLEHRRIYNRVFSAAGDGVVGHAPSGVAESVQHVDDFDVWHVRGLQVRR